ncbi:MAG TPA: cellulase family glycosylhydrolase, partial [Isosphaeraceae bacterium]|nr:cellulase family glycosylhydrolase [Isosphaeraceae bacterium]
MLCWLAFACGLIGTARSPARAQDPLFPFVLPWNDASPSVANVSAWLETPAGASGPVTARMGHLWAGSKRIRLLGVNTCFGASFPTHAEAEQVAARMAKFGINCVRFHHMDMFPAPGGIFEKGGTGLDSGQLDRLDYFLAQLKAHGIYADLNLHVSRTYPGLPTWPEMPSFHKGVDQFDARMIDWQKRYARELLTHQNPYTKTRYVNEPAVALVEINNENALLHEWWSGGLDLMPAAYADELAKAWNDWLAGKYADFAALKRAWVKERPIGPEMVKNSAFNAGTDGWFLEEHEGAKASAAPGDSGSKGTRAVKITVERAGNAGWHIQL